MGGFHARSDGNGRGLWFAILGIAGLLGVLLLLGCSDDLPRRGPGPVGPVGPVVDESGIPGSGIVVSEPRSVSGVDAVAFATEGFVIIAVGGSETLSVEADDNLQQYLEVSVVDGLLTIATREGIDIVPSEPPVFHVEVEDLTAVGLMGAGTIAVDLIDAERFEIDLGGVGDITIGSVTVDELVADLTGVGTVTLAGNAGRQDLFVGGVTVYEGRDVASRVTAIEAGGSGRATVWVLESLDVTASGTASVEYYGTPSLSERLSASATVASLGAK